MLNFGNFNWVSRNSQIPMQLFFNHAVNREIPRINCKFKNQETHWKEWKFVRGNFGTVIYQSKHHVMFRHVERNINGIYRGCDVITNTRTWNYRFKDGWQVRKKGWVGKGQIIASRFENKLHSRIWTAYWNTSFRSKTNYHRLPHFYHTFTSPVPIKNIQNQPMLRSCTTKTYKTLN